MKIIDTIAAINSSARESGNQVLLDEYAEFIKTKGFDEYGIPDDKNEEVLKFLCNKIKKGNYELDLPGIDLAKLLETYSDPDQDAIDKSDNDTTVPEIAPEVAAEKVESLEEVLADRERVNLELVVAKQMLVQLDNKVSVYESIDLDIVLDTLEKYEALGTPDELESAMKSKTEASIDTSNINLEREEMKTNLKDLKPEELLARLESYVALGSVEDIQALATKAEAQATTINDLTTTNEKLESDLDKYIDIGTVEEVLNIVTDYADIRTKEEAQKLATEFDLPLEKVESIISKTDTIDAARDVISLLATPKLEAAPLVPAETVVTEPVIVADPTTAKPESAQIDLENDQDALQKAESHKDTMEQLRNTCMVI